MASFSYPGSAHNSGAVTDAEYDSLADYIPEGLEGRPTDTPLVSASGASRAVTVAANRVAIVRGRVYNSGTSAISLSIAANSSGSTRVDLVVLRYDKTAFTVTEHVITGTPGAGAPSPVDDSSNHDMSIARVTVVNGASVINAVDVTSISWCVGGPTLWGNTFFPVPKTSKPYLMYQEAAAELWLRPTGAGSPAPLWRDSGEVSVSAQSGFSASVTVRRITASVWMHGYWTRTGANLSPSTSVQVGTVPDGYRPPRKVYFGGYLTGSSLATGAVDTNGVITVTGYYDSSWAKNETLYLFDVSWPLTS